MTFPSFSSLRLALLLSLMACFSITYSQDSDQPGAEDFKHRFWQLGAEVQVYPTGVIPGLAVEFGIDPKWGKNALNFRLGYNLFDHRDLGVHDEEIGGGPGFSLGYRRYLSGEYARWFLGVKSDVWFNSVDWKDDLEDGTTAVGETDIIVLQPTAELGYTFFVGGSRGAGLRISPSVAFGWEWNAQTEGQPTGEGAILLVGARLQYRLK